MHPGVRQAFEKSLMRFVAQVRKSVQASQRHANTNNPGPGHSSQRGAIDARLNYYRGAQPTVTPQRLERVFVVIPKEGRSRNDSEGDTMLIQRRQELFGTEVIVRLSPRSRHKRHVAREDMCMGVD